MVKAAHDFYEIPRTATFGWQGLRATLQEENKDTPPAGGGTPPPPAGGAAGKTPEQQRIAELEGKLKEFEKRESDRVAAETAAENDRKQKLEDAGDHKKLAELARKEADEAKAALELAKADAEYGKQARAAEQKAIDEEKAKLPEEARALVDAQATIEGKRALIKLLGGQTTTAQPGPPGGPPPPGGTIDFAEAFKKGPVAWAEAKKRDEKGANAWMQKRMTEPANGAHRPLAHLPLPSVPQKQ